MIEIIAILLTAFFFVFFGELLLTPTWEDSPEWIKAEAARLESETQKGGD
jgi:hypothetical protein